MKNAKRNVIVSAILTIALCFSLMIGGTYAWFTDSAKVNVNTIVSGSLKVGLNMWDEENEQWVDADGKTLFVYPYRRGRRRQRSLGSRLQVQTS